MARKHVVVAALASVAAILAGGTLAIRSSDGKPHAVRGAPASDQERVVRIEGQLAELKDSLAQLAARPERYVEVPAAVSASRGTSKPSAVQDQEIRPRSPDEQAAASKALVNSLEGRFASEATDRGWAKSVESRLQERAAAALPTGSQLERLECKATICRMETSHADSMAFQAFLESTTRSPEFWTGERLVSVLNKDSDGHMDTVMFLARDSQSLRPQTTGTL